jgi:Mrp family chromosome partitioning ATPase
MVDTVLVVSRVGRTTAADAERCADLLEQLAAPTLGVVMVGVTMPLFSDYFSYAAPRRTRRLAAEEAGEAEEARPDSIIGHEQPDLRQPGRHAPPSRPVGAGPVEPPGNDR